MRSLRTHHKMTLLTSNSLQTMTKTFSTIALVLLFASEAFSFTFDLPALGLHTQLPLLHDVAASYSPNLLLDNPATTIAAASVTVGETNPLLSAYSTYAQALKTEPMRTKVVTGVCLAVVGDAIAQTRDPKPYDTKRAYSFAAFDGFYRAVQQITYPPLIAFFQGQFLVGLMGTLGLTVSQDIVPLVAAFEQTLFSQLVIIPTLYYPVFYAITGAVQGLTIEQTVQRAKDTFILLMKRNLLFWIPVQFGVFGFVEESLQITMFIIFGLIWTVILSISAGSVQSEDTEDAAVQEEVYCVTGMEDNCMIDPDDLFQAPNGLQSSNEDMLIDESIGNAKSVSTTTEEPMQGKRARETVGVGSNQTKDSN